MEGLTLGHLISKHWSCIAMGNTHTRRDPQLYTTHLVGRRTTNTNPRHSGNIQFCISKCNIMLTLNVHDFTNAFFKA